MFYDYELKKSSPCLTWMVPMCVEVVIEPEGNWVTLHDSRHTEQGSLMFSKKEWAAFADGVKNEVFDI